MLVFSAKTSDRNAQATPEISEISIILFIEFDSCREIAEGIIIKEVVKNIPTIWVDKAVATAVMTKKESSQNFTLIPDICAKSRFRLIRAILFFAKVTKIAQTEAKIASALIS